MRYEEPVTTPDPKDPGRTITTHPAQGQITLSRASGKASLYGSDFDPSHYISLTIHTSKLHRHLNNDWHHTDREIITVEMTEAQFATLITSVGLGKGSLCTIARRDMKSVPQLPPAKPRADQFKAELLGEMSDTIETMKAAIAEVEGMKLPKGKTDRIKSLFGQLEKMLSGSVPFIASQFDEHMETTVEAAKMHLHGHITGAGLQSLGLNPEAPLQIGNGPKE